MYKSITTGTASRTRSLRAILVTKQTKRLPEGAGDPESARSALKRPDFRCRPGEVVWVDKDLVLVGAGESKGIDTDRFRTIGGMMVRGLFAVDAARV